MRWKFWLAGLLALAASTASAVPLDSVTTFCGLFPAACRSGTESLLAARGEGTNAYYVLEADPTSGGLLVDVVAGTITATNPSVGPTGSSVPADGTYVGLNNGGTLIGAVGDSSGRQIVVGAGTAGSATGGVLTVQGSASGTPIPVTATGSGSFTTNVAQFGGNNVVTGTGTGGNGIPRVTVSSDSSLSATNFPATVDVNTGLVGASTPRFAQGGFPSTTTVVASNDYSGSNVGTGAYVQLIASTGSASNTICVSSSNGSPIKIATGAAASEVDRIYLPGGGSGCYLLNIPVSTRISLKSISGTASTGFFLYTGY